jgi:tRNA(Ile2)-agmatinylcytidine synthase
VGWLGLDDTDSLEQGCTTYTFHLLLEGLPDSVQISTPKLVRLWPFAQQRTRGNAAVAVELKTEDEEQLLAYLETFWKQNIVPLAGRLSESNHDVRQQYPSDPGMVWFSSDRPDETFYAASVRQEVQLSDVPSATRAWGGQGRIGATAAVSWRERQPTWEAIVWRRVERHGQNERLVCDSTLERIDQLPSTFLSRDPRKGTSLVAPRGPCPVLFGVRARDFTTAQYAGLELRNAEQTEDSIGMRVFVTNQATDDHLSEPVQTTVLSSEILNRGSTCIVTENGQWMAFEESGPIKRLAQWFKPGDVIEGNGLSPEAGLLHLEKLRLISSVPSRERPMCIKCRVRMKSMGSGQGCRCPKCKDRTDDVWNEVARIPPFTSWVQPPHGSRRHLAKPLEW